MDEKSAMDELVGFVLRVSQGNPGAMNFMTDALDRAQKEGDGYMRRWLVAFQRAEVIGVMGSHLYAIYNDVCSKDVDKALNVLVNHSATTLRELGGVR